MVRFSRMNSVLEFLMSNMLGWSLPYRMPPEKIREGFFILRLIMEKSFREIHEQSVIEVDGELIKLCMTFLKKKHFEYRLLWKTFYLVFQYFEKYRHPALTPLVADWLYFMVFDTLYIRFVVSRQDFSVFCNRSQHCFPSLLSDAYDRERDNVFWRLMRAPYSNDLADPPPKEMNVVWKVAKVADTHRLLPIFLRHGVAYMPPSSSSCHLKSCTSTLERICQSADVLCCGCDILGEISPSELVYKIDPEEPEKRRRMYTVFRAMDVVQRKIAAGTSNDPDAKHDFVDRFRMIFDTIPEPTVTVQEVRCILEALFPPRSGNRGIADAFCGRFEELMPESKAPKSPRTLKHLSCCQVRECLRTSGNYPYGVCGLLIPDSLKKRLLLERWFGPETLRGEYEGLSFWGQERSEWQWVTEARRATSPFIRGANAIIWNAAVDIERRAVGFYENRPRKRLRLDDEED